MFGKLLADIRNQANGANRSAARLKIVAVTSEPLDVKVLLKERHEYTLNITLGVDNFDREQPAQARLLRELRVVRLPAGVPGQGVVQAPLPWCQTVGKSLLAMAHEYGRVKMLFQFNMRA